MNAQAPIRSMTGYASVRRDTEAGELSISLRSVNHRGLDLHFHHSPEFAQFETEMRAALKAGLQRGHVEIRTSLARSSGGEGSTIDRPVLMQYAEAFRQAARELNIVAEPDLNTLIGLPGVLKASETRRFEAGFAREVAGVLHECVRLLNESREREGAELALQIREELGGLESNAAQIHSIRQQATGLFYQRLQERLRDLLNGASVSESRLTEEAALLADRSDIQEEITRLRVHAKELRQILDGGGEVGKRLDFLLQEMNREANTILSKTSGIGEIGLTVTRLGLAVKSHIEKIREQALNLE